MSLDRYQPNPLDGPSGFADKIRDLERRLAALEGGRNLRAATVGRGGRTRFAAGGQILLQNDDDQNTTVIGEVYDDSLERTAYGLLVQERFSGSTEGRDVLLVTDHGWGIPEWVVPLAGPGMEFSTSSTSYTRAWQQATRVMAKNLYLSMRLLPPGGQTISYRVQMSVDDGVTLVDVYELTGVAANTNDSQTHAMPSGIEVGMWASIFIDVKVSGGTGSLYPRFGPYWYVPNGSYEGTPS